MSGAGYASNSTLSLGAYAPYFRIGEYLFDPSGQNASYLYKSLNKDEMKEHLMKHFTKEEVINMLLDFVVNEDEGSDSAA